jgi:ribosomal protein S21
MVKVVIKPGKPDEEVARAISRLRKILDQSGIRREMTERERYRKPSEIRHEARNRAIRRTQTLAKKQKYRP